MRKDRPPMALYSDEMAQETSFLENDTTFFQSVDIELNSSYSSKRIRTQRSFDASKIGTTLQNAPLFKAFENDCCFSGSLIRGFKNGYHWQHRCPLTKWTGIKLWETVHPPLS